MADLVFDGVVLPIWRQNRAPDFVIGAPGNVYLQRWNVIPKNRWLNVYVHHILRSDDDRALHDHPWWNVSLILSGGYFEHVIKAGGVHRRTWRGQGALKFRLACAAHRLEVVDRVDCWTLFFTGPKCRDWGFHCPNAGWVDWRDFTLPGDEGQVGQGCGEGET